MMPQLFQFALQSLVCLFSLQNKAKTVKLMDDNNRKTKYNKA